MKRWMSYLIIFETLICLTSVTSADSFSGSQAITLYGDDNISDGVQLESSDVNLTTSTIDGLTYTVTLGSEGPSLSMVRSGNLFSLNPQPQLTGHGKFANSYMLSNGVTGAFLFVGQEIHNPLDISIHVATWAADKPIVASQITGDWAMMEIYDNNLKDDPEEAFSVTNRILTITDLGDNQVEVQLDSLLDPPWRMQINGNMLEPIPGTLDPYPSMAHLSMMTDGQSLVMAGLGVEPWDATDVSASIAFSTRPIYFPAPNEPVVFNESDFAGTWQIHGLISGNDSYRPGWYHYSVTFDKNANPTFTNVVDSMGNTDYVPETGTWAIDETGGVSIPDIPQIQFNGVMSRTKDLIVAVATMAPGSYQDIRGYNLQILQKQPETICTTNDLEGIWNMHGLVSGDGSTWRGWYHFAAQIDDEGNLSTIPGSYANSNGETDVTVETTLTIKSNGILGQTFAPEAHGALSLGKDFIVNTMNEYSGGSKGSKLDIFQKQSDVTFKQSDLAGNWSLHGLVSGYGSDWKGWVRGAMGIQADGSYTNLVLNSSGDNFSGFGTVSLTTDGTFAIETPFSRSSHGTMSTDKEVIVFTMDDGGGGYSLYLMTRRNP